MLPAELLVPSVGDGAGAGFPQALGRSQIDAPCASGVKWVSGHSFSGSFWIFKMCQGRTPARQGMCTPNRKGNRKQEEEIQHFHSSDYLRFTTVTV